MTVPTPLQIALRQSRTRPTVVSGSIAGVGGGIAGQSKTAVGPAQARGRWCNARRFNRDWRLPMAVALPMMSSSLRLTVGGAEMQTEPINQQNAFALEMETWALVAELAKPLMGYHAIPALIALRIVISRRIRQMDDPDDTLRLFIADLNAALNQKPARPN